MKRLHLLSACLVVFTLSVAVVWAAEGTSWGTVKALGPPQQPPAAKMVRIPIVFDAPWAAFEIIDEGYDQNPKNADIEIKRGWAVRWNEFVQPAEPAAGSAYAEGWGDIFAHWQWNGKQGWSRESFFVSYDLTLWGTGHDQLDGEHGVFTGQGTGYYNPTEEYPEVCRYVLHGSGDLAGIILDLTDATVPALEATRIEGDILVPPSFLK